ncbi:hypothetical protein RFI_14063 [Reticulomyxa filosa]|uniref:Fatty acid desaturase domain-containing protein n=1 Tax=Reticulomyxa filosa TaxID=46433 RepID=X6NB42_RETFI|nr:hypothetical protein RFI_14063 [Reticulomyxa filosa]|eukprot:ETO23123.1 hypothetical protein RFI_14063 [Reticulomyxa filosa]
MWCVCVWVIWNRSNLTSFGYVLRDLIATSVVIYLGGYIDLIPNIIVRLIVLFVYCFILGTVMMGMWVLAHECGHQAFSPSLIVNDAVGCVLHTTLFVPYWSWKYSHAKHHANVNSMEKDSVFIPRTDLTADLKRTSEPPLFKRIFGLIRFLSLGLIVHLLVNAVSCKVEKPNNKKKSAVDIFAEKLGLDRWNSHFNPFCHLWRTTEQKIGVTASVVAIFVWVWILYRLTLHFGVVLMLKNYFVPYLWVNIWLIIITFLHHTDLAVPKYYSEKWTWLRGALGTVDRDYGIMNVLHHHITDTHVLHHIFSQIPHYHAQEATKALLDSHLIDEYYLYDPTPWYVALWRSYTQCWYVRHDQPITWFESFKTKHQ